MFFVGIECTFRRTCSRQIDYLSLQYSRKRAPTYTNDRRSRFKLMIRVVQTIYFFFLFFCIDQMKVGRLRSFIWNHGAAVFHLLSSWTTSSPWYFSKKLFASKLLASSCLFFSSIVNNPHRSILNRVPSQNVSYSGSNSFS